MQLATSNDYIPFDPIVKLSCSLFKSVPSFYIPDDFTFHEESPSFLPNSRMIDETLPFVGRLPSLGRNETSGRTKAAVSAGLCAVPRRRADLGVRWHHHWPANGRFPSQGIMGYATTAMATRWTTTSSEISRYSWAWKPNGLPMLHTRFSTLHRRSINVSAPVHRSRWWSSFDASICQLSVNVCVCVCLRVNASIYVCRCVEDAENRFHVNVYPREATFVCRNRMKNTTRIRSIFFDLLILRGIGVTSRQTDCARLCIYGTPRRPQTFRFNSVTWRENIRLFQNFHFIRFPLISFVL